MEIDNPNPITNNNFICSVIKPAVDGSYVVKDLKVERHEPYTFYFNAIIGYWSMPLISNNGYVRSYEQNIQSTIFNTKIESEYQLFLSVNKTKLVPQMKDIIKDVKPEVNDKDFNKFLDTKIPDLISIPIPVDFDVRIKKLFIEYMNLQGTYNFKKNKMGELDEDKKTKNLITKCVQEIFGLFINDKDPASKNAFSYIFDIDNNVYIKTDSYIDCTIAIRTIYDNLQFTKISGDNKNENYKHLYELLPERAKKNNNNNNNNATLVMFKNIDQKIISINDNNNISNNNNNTLVIRNNAVTSNRSNNNKKIKNEDNVNNDLLYNVKKQWDNLFKNIKKGFDDNNTTNIGLTINNTTDTDKIFNPLKIPSKYWKSFQYEDCKVHDDLDITKEYYNYLEICGKYKYSITCMDLYFYENENINKKVMRMLKDIKESDSNKEFCSNVKKWEFIESLAKLAYNELKGIIHEKLIYRWMLFKCLSEYEPDFRIITDYFYISFPVLEERDSFLWIGTRECRTDHLEFYNELVFTDDLSKERKKKFFQDDEVRYKITNGFIKEINKEKSPFSKVYWFTIKFGLYLNCMSENNQEELLEKLKLFQTAKKEDCNSFMKTINSYINTNENKKPGSIKRILSDFIVDLKNVVTETIFSVGKKKFKWNSKAPKLLFTNDKGEIDDDLTLPWYYCTMARTFTERKEQELDEFTYYINHGKLKKGRSPLTKNKRKKRRTNTTSVAEEKKESDDDYVVENKKRKRSNKNKKSKEEESSEEGEKRNKKKQKKGKESPIIPSKLSITLNDKENEKDEVPSPPLSPVVINNSPPPSPVVSTNEKENTFDNITTPVFIDMSSVPTQLKNVTTNKGEKENNIDVIHTPVFNNDEGFYVPNQEEEILIETNNNKKEKVYLESSSKTDSESESENENKNKKHKRSKYVESEDEENQYDDEEYEEEEKEINSKKTESLKKKNQKI